MCDKNVNHEQKLINSFVSAYVNKFSSAKIIAQNCRSKTKADVEIDNEGIYYVIEAKSHNSADKYNARHKLFGELLKEIGRNREIKNICYAILLPKDDEGFDFFRKGFLLIGKKHCDMFGKIFPDLKVFVHSEINNSFEEKKWDCFFS